MSNALAELLSRPLSSRNSDDYEAVINGYIKFAGGGRVDDRFKIPDSTKNADYYIFRKYFELIIELKQITKFINNLSVDDYFIRLLNQGRLLSRKTISSTKIRVGPESLTARDWREFYSKFRPSVTTHLDKAAKQLKATTSFIPRQHAELPRYHGVIMLNSNDYNLSTDLLHRLVEFRTKEKWARGLYSCLDFVACLSLDMVNEGRHLLHSRHIVRGMDQPILIDAIRYLFDRWVHYGAIGIGATVTFTPGGELEIPINADAKILGKIRR